MKSIILKISAYKEKDGVVTALSKEGISTFIVKGLLSSKSKFLALNNPLTIATLTFSDNTKYKYKILKEADILYSPFNLMGRLKHLGLIMLLADIINASMQDEEKIVVFQYILSSLEDIYKNQKIYENVLFLLFKILDVTGYSFDVSECALCGKKNNIVTFSFLKGGFICRDCFKEDDKIIVNTETLLKMRTLILASENKFNNLTIEENDFNNILKEIIIFIEDNFGLSIKNKELVI